MKVAIVDETSGNPFPTKITLVNKMQTAFSHISTEGYYHNNDLIKETTKKLAELIGLNKGQKTIDVGYGSNLSVSEAMRELGMNTYGLDSQDGLDRKKYPNAFIIPSHFNAEQKFDPLRNSNSYFY